MFQKLYALTAALMLTAASLLAQATNQVSAVKNNSSITIDGSLIEPSWKSFTAISKTVVGTPNNTASFSVSWNATYLYVGLKVKDANLYNESTNPWDDDAFEIFIDANNNGGNSYDANDRQFVKDYNSSTIFEKNSKTTGVLHAWALTNDGYSMEIAIPWSNISITSPSAGLTIGFDVAHDDDDNGGGRDHQTVWQGDGNNWQYTQNFGDLVLANHTDATAPSSPTNLTASGITNKSLQLNWTASTDNAAVAGYDVYRGTTKINRALVNATSLEVFNLTAATAYSFYVVAIDSAGNSSANSSTLNVTTLNSTCSGTGSINFHKWNNINGTAVSNLTSNSAYPNSPSSSSTLTSLEIPSNAGDNYGVRLFGYLCAPTTGAYNFWIAGDDQVELWLSTTNSAANRVKIASHTAYTNSREWNKYTSQKSATINLVAGELYFIEALMKEGAVGDNLAIGWRKPGEGTTTPSEVIPGSQVRLALPDLTAPAVATNLNATSITANTLTLNWTAGTDNTAVTGYDVYVNGRKYNSTNITTTSYNVTGLKNSTTYNFTVVAKDAEGNRSSESNGLNVTTLDTPDNTAPTAPTSLNASNIGLSTFILKWTASTDNVGVAGYQVLQNGTVVNTALTSNNSYTLSGLTPGSTYSYTVVAKDAAGNTSTASTALSVTMLLPTPGTETFTMRTILANQRMPHDLVWGPDNNLWFIERFGGNVSFVNPSTNAETVTLTLGSAMARTGGQDGLFGLAVHPQLLTGKPYVYIAYTYESSSATARKTRIARYTYNSTNKTLSSPVTILENIPGSNDHNSGRLEIGPDAKLYYTVGDMGAGQFDNASRTNNAQTNNSLEGKILRLNTEADANNSWIPTDNPFVNNSNYLPSIYTKGHRNAQGLVWGNVNGTNILYSSEHGPYSDDEVNIIQAGKNYGWPNTIGFCDGNYNGRTSGGFTISNEQNNCSSITATEPIKGMFAVTTPPDPSSDFLTWPSVAPSGTTFYGSTAIPGWQNSLLIAQLKKGAVCRFKLSNDGLTITSDTIHYFKGLGRFRDVAVSADGLKIYVACDSSGSTSGPTGSTTSTPANPGSILEFTYVSPTNRVAPTLVKNELTNNAYAIYPNPANDKVSFKTPKQATAGRIQISNAMGKPMGSYLINGKMAVTTVETAGLITGIYYVTITDASGKLLHTQKLVIAK